jgi:prepilin-type N-terminal cleavage/methylation domain-containing protein
MVNRQRSHRIRFGFVLIEMLVVVSVIAFLTSIAMLSFSAVSGKMYFKRKADNLVTVLQTAWNAAQQSDRRYVVVLSFKEQTWLLQEMMPADAEVFNPDDATIKSGYFDDRFILDYVLYDDGMDTRVSMEGTVNADAFLVAGHAGWQSGGKVVLRDEDGNFWSILLYRIGKPVELVPGDVDILLAQDAKYMQF